MKVFSCRTISYRPGARNEQQTTMRQWEESRLLRKWRSSRKNVGGGAGKRRQRRSDRKRHRRRCVVTDCRTRRRWNIDGLLVAPATVTLSSAMTRQSYAATAALWSGTNKNQDISTGPLARLFAHSLVPLTRFAGSILLALLAPSAALTHSLARSLRSLPRS